MKWLLPLIALAVLAAGIWYFTRDDDEDEPTPTVAATTAATTGDDEEGEATVEAAGTDAEGTVEADVAAVEGTVEAGADAVVAGAEGTVEAAAGTVEAAVSAVEGTVEAVAAGDASPEASPAASPVAADGLVLTARDIAYDPTTLTIQAADEPVTITFENVGAAEHDFVIDALEIHVVAMPGETVDIVIPAGTAPGTYDFYCSVPGHKEAGMVGTLVVE